MVASGTVTFLAGETSKTITVNVVGDTVIEPDETFNVTLSNATGGLTITDGLAIVTITNDDIAPASTITITATNGAEGGAPVVITLNRTGSITGVLTVNVAESGAMSDLTATPTVTGGTWNATANTVTFNTGSSTVTITFAVVDDATVEAVESVTFTLATGAGYAVGAPSVATANISDNDAATPSVSVVATNGAEGGAAIIVTLSRTGSTSAALTVNATEGGTSLPADWTSTVTGGTWNATGNTVTFNAGSSTVTITLAIVNDTADEGQETLTIALAAGAGYTVGSPSAATATITDNDAPAALPTLTISDVSVTEGNNGGPTVTATLTVTRTGDTTGTSTVNWAAVAGTATAAGDYQTASGTLTFTAGQTSKTITITITPDKKAEPTETFTVVLSSPTGATIVDSTGVVTIVDNDGALFAVGNGDGAVGGGAAAAVSATDVSDALRAAVDVWVARGATPEQLAGLTVVFGDLPGAKLADTLGTTITIDLDAAGWGWAALGSLTESTIDLVSVLEHELGHVLGLEHGDGVMAEVLAPGQRWFEPARVGVTADTDGSRSASAPALDSAMLVSVATSATALGLATALDVFGAAEPVVVGVKPVAPAALALPALGRSLHVPAVVEAAAGASRAVLPGVDTRLPIGLPASITWYLVALGLVVTQIRRRRAFDAR